MRIHGMYKTLLLWLSLSLFIILAIPTASTASITRDEQVRLWSALIEAKQTSPAGKPGKWNIIEGITLIKKVDDASLKASALATIIHYYDDKDKIWYGKEINDETTAKWSDRKKILLEDAEKNADKYHRHLDTLYKERDEARKDYPDKKYTSGIGTALVMEKYLRRNRNDIARATRDFAANRGLAVDVHAGKHLRFDEIAGFIDRNIPIILNPIATDNYLICVGYIKRSTEEYLITVDLNKILFEEVSHADGIIGKGEWAKKRRETAKQYDKQFGLLKGDKKFNLKGTLQVGIGITDYRQGDYAGYVITDFKLTEDSFENYLRLLKNQ